MHNLLFTVLGIGTFNIGGEGNYIFDLFTSIRASCLSGASAVTSLAVTVACFIIVFKMVKIANDMMSDDQASGFGTVGMWDLVRPFVILLLLESSTFVIGALDGVCNTVTVSMVNSVGGTTNMKSMALAMYDTNAKIIDAQTGRDTSKEYTEADDLSLIQEDGITPTQTEDQVMGMLILNKIRKSVNKNRVVKEGAEGAVDQAVADGTITPEEAQAKKEDKKFMKDVQKNLKKELQGNSKLQNISEDAVSFRSGTFVAALCMTIYDILFKVIQCFGEIMLCILGMLFPWVLVISLINPFRRVLPDFFGNYIRISFWKVIAAAINFVVCTVQVAGINFQIQRTAANLDNLLTAATGAESTSMSGGVVFTMIMSIAGIFAMLKVDSIAGMIVPSSNPVGDMGGAAAATGAMKTAASVPGKVAGGVHTVKSRRSQKESAANEKSFRDSVIGGIQNIGNSVSELGNRD